VAHRGGGNLQSNCETSLLTIEEKVRAALASKGQADFVKTSTGFSTGGATAEDVCVDAAVVGNGHWRKSLGRGTDIRRYEKKWLCGATRIGASGQRQNHGAGGRFGGFSSDCLRLTGIKFVLISAPLFQFSRIRCWVIHRFFTRA